MKEGVDGGKWFKNVIELSKVPINEWSNSFG